MAKKCSRYEKMLDKKKAIQVCKVHQKKKTTALQDAIAMAEKKIAMKKAKRISKKTRKSVESSRKKGKKVTGL